MKRYSLVFFLVGSLVMIFVLTKTGEPLKTPSTPAGIINLELAFTQAKTETVINTWATINSTDTLAAARLNTWLDFIFIFFYSGLLFLSSKMITRTFAGAFGRAGRLVARAAILAGILDVLENTGMLLSLAGQGSAFISLATGICSAIKWGLALIAVLYVITGVVGMLRSGISNR